MTKELSLTIISRSPPAQVTVSSHMNLAFALQGAL